MFKNILSLFKQSIVYGLGTIIERVLAFLMLPIFTNTLTKEELGIYFLWFAAVMLINPFYLMGISNALIRFYSATDNRNEQKKIFSTSFWMILSIGLTISGLGILFAPWISKIIFSPEVPKKFTIYLFCVLAIDALNYLTLNALKAEQRVVTFALVSIGSGLAIPIFTIYFIIYAKMGALGAVLALVWVAVIKFLFLFFSFIRTRLTWQFSGTTITELLKFGLPFVPTLLAFSLMSSIDKFFLENYLGFDVVGIYGAGCRLGMVLALFTKAFQYAWEPYIAGTYREPDSPQMFSKILTYFVVITGFVFLIFSLLIDEIVRFKLGSFTFFGPEYYGSTQIVPVVMLGSFIYGIYVNLMIGVYIEKKSYYFTILTIVAAVLNLGLNYLLIPHFGMPGAAWATTAAYFLMMVWMYFLNQKHFPVPYEFGRILQLLLIYSAIFFLPQLAPFFSSTIIKTCLLIFTIPLLFLFKFFDKKEIEVLRKFLKRW